MSISQTAVTSLRNVINIEQKPRSMTKILLLDIKMGIKYNILTKQKIFLDDCNRANICPADIISIAKSVEGHGNNARNRFHEKKIIRLRSVNAARQARDQKSRWETTSRETYRIVRLSQEGRRVFNEIKESEMQRVWIEMTIKYQKKIEWLKMKQGKIKKKVPEKYEEVIVSDEALRKEFGETVIEPRVYGGIDVSEDMAEFLKLPASLRRFPRVSELKEEVRAEITATKQRWTVREMDEEGVDKLSIDERKIKKDRDKEERKVCDGKRIDFARVRATEMSHNKTINMPKQVELRKEIKIQNQRIETVDQIKKYVREMCDKDGNIVGAEVLSEKEMRGMKEIEEGIKDKGWMLYTTDKSGMLVLDTKKQIF
jgi:hypothetical protein